MYIIEEFDANKIYPSAKALREVERMNMVSFNNNPSPWYKKSDRSLKIVSLNCAGLKAHYQDVKNDKRLMKADLISLLETSLESDEKENDFPLADYDKSFLNVGTGKGIGSYFNKNKFRICEKVPNKKFQVARFHNEDIDIISIYRSQLGNSMDLLQEIKHMTDPQKLKP